MKEINELRLPEGLKYSQNHEWFKEEGGRTRIGVSDFAQDQLGDIVFVELPEVGISLKQGDEFCTLESVKAVAEVYMPVDGEVLKVNEELTDNPELINQDPYSEGWLIEVRPDNSSGPESFMDSEQYREFLKGGE